VEDESVRRRFLLVLLLVVGGEEEWFRAATRALPLQDLHPAQRGGSYPLPRSPAAGGRDGGDGARQWMAAARARETREKGAVDLDLLW
jgi:hypothetical protein